MIRKFFDPAATSEPATQTKTSIASLMAQHGVVNNSAESVAKPISIPEEKEEPVKETETAPAATATQTQATEPAKPETPSQPQEPLKTETVPQKEAAPEVKPLTLQEVLRQHQPEAILKELGYDDKVVNEFKELDPKMLGFLRHWKEKGDVNEYLQALSTDYSKMPAEDVMRRQLQRDYPKASPQQIEALYKSKIVNAYNLNSDDETELEEGRMLLEAEADKHRDNFIQKQQEFLLSKPPEAKQPEPDNSAELAKKQFESYQSAVNEHPYTKAINTNKAITLGEGDDKFTFPVDPKDLTEMLFDPNKWSEAMFDKEGKPDVEHQLLLAGVAKYGKAFFTEYAKHFKSLGGKTVVDTIDNASPTNANNTSTPAAAAPTSPAEAMAKHGRLV